MKYLVFFAAVFSVSLAKPALPSTSAPIEIVAFESEALPDGSYHYNFEGSDGSSASQEGSLKYVDDKHAGEAVKGRFQYTGDDGKQYLLSYTADETGYHPVGDHLPTPPPVPELPPAVARALEFIATHSTTEPPKSG